MPLSCSGQSSCDCAIMSSAAAGERQDFRDSRQFPECGKTKENPTIFLRFYQDMFDHDTAMSNFGQFSPLDLLHFLQWFFFPFPPAFLCNLVRKSPQHLEKIP